MESRQSGIVSNGVLAVTGAIAPGGTNAIGTLTVANSAGLQPIKPQLALAFLPQPLRLTA